MSGVLVLSLLLMGCQDRQARSDNARLAARVLMLEQQVTQLRQAQTEASAVGAPDGFMERAAAQNCANDLSRTLETFRQDSIDGVYPTPARLTEKAYAFALVDESGAELAQGSGP
jgi:hypothetical protein